MYSSLVTEENTFNLVIHLLIRRGIKVYFLYHIKKKQETELNLENRVT